MLNNIHRQTARRFYCICGLYATPCTCNDPLYHILNRNGKYITTLQCVLYTWTYMSSLSERHALALIGTHVKQLTKKRSKEAASEVPHKRPRKHGEKNN